MAYDATDIAALIDEEAQRQGVSPDFAKRIVLRGENFGNKKITDATSPAGATGVGQIMPATWKSLVAKGLLSPDDKPDDPRASVKASVAVLKDNLSRSGGSEMVAAAEYNGGKAARDAVLAGKPPPAQETREYLKRTGFDPVYGEGAGGSQATVVGGTRSDQLIGNVQDAFKATLAKNAELIRQLRAATGNTVDANAVIADAAMGEGAARAGSIEAKAAIDVAQQQKAQEIVELFHSGVKDPENVIRASLRKSAEADEAMAQLKPVIDAEDQVMVWDDPLRWIANQFTQPGLKMAYNAAHASKAKAVKDVAEARRMFEAQVVMDPAITINQTQQKAALDAAAVRFDALKQATVAQKDSQHALAQTAVQEILQNNHTYQGTVEISRMSLSASGIRREEIADKRAAEAIDVYNNKVIALGGEPVKVGQYETLSAKEKDRIFRGSRSASLGGDAGESMRFILESDTGPTLATAMPAVNDFYVKLQKSPEYKRMEEAIRQNPKFAAMPASEQRLMALTELHHAQVQDLENKKGKNSLLPDSNPYKLKLLNTIQFPELAGNPIVGFVKESLATAPDQTTVKDKDVFDRTVAALQANPKRMKELSVALSQFYTVGIDRQWANQGPMMVGYTRPNGYGVSGDSVDQQFEKAVQMANPVEVERALLSALTARKKAEASQQDAMPWWMDPKGE